MMAKQHVMSRPGAKVPAPKKRAAAGSLDYPATTVGTTAHVTVMQADALGDVGSRCAADVLSRAEADWQRMQDLFGASVVLPSCTVVVAPLSTGRDGTGGAYHYGCADTTLYCDCDVQVPEATSALFMAELSEVGQAVQAMGWDCGATNGEGLSRVHAAQLYPLVLDDYSTAAVWLDSPRPNWVDSNEGTDQDPASNGCAVTFISWLMSLGYTLPQITQAGASSLAMTYSALTGKPDAWTDFGAACQLRWPAGQASGVITDDPFAGPPKPPAPATGRIVVLIGQDVNGQEVARFAVE